MQPEACGAHLSFLICPFCIRDLLTMPESMQHQASSSTNPQALGGDADGGAHLTG